MSELSQDEVHDAVRVAMEASIEQILAVRSMEFGEELAAEGEEANFFVTCLLLLVGKLSSYLLCALPWDVRDRMELQLHSQVSVARKISRLQEGSAKGPELNGSQEAGEEE